MPSRDKGAKYEDTQAQSNDFLRNKTLLKL